MMRPKPLTAALMASPDDAEAQLYEALQTGDIDKLMATWADDDDIACVHPGGVRLVGAGPIRASFEAMFRAELNSIMAAEVADQMRGGSLQMIPSGGVQ